MSGLDAMWHEADDALLRCRELAHESFLAGGVPVGSVIAGSNGERVSEGRNRAYDPAGGTDQPQCTPVAHAEMNALAAVETGTELASLTLWSSQRPCVLCAAACEFTGAGSVAFVAPDPSDGDSYDDPGGVEPEWVVVANLLLLSGVAAYLGSSSSMITRARRRGPEIVDLMRMVDDTALRQATLRDTPPQCGRGSPVWPRIEAAARERRKRSRRDSPR